MPPAWEDAVRAASIGKIDQYAAGLDDAVAHTDLGLVATPWWWRLGRAAQWLLLATALVGLGWTIEAVAMSLARDPDPSVMEVGGVWLPVILLAGGLAVGLALALVCRVAARASARRRASRAVERLRGTIQRVTDIVIIGPMQDEVDAYVRCRDGVAAALKH
jgi:hypothetical protein